MHEKGTTCDTLKIEIEMTLKIWLLLCKAVLTWLCYIT